MFESFGGTFVLKHEPCFSYKRKKYVDKCLILFITSTCIESTSYCWMYFIINA